MTVVASQSVFSLSPAVSYQPTGDGAVILRIGDGQLYTCNATSEAFLRHVDGRQTLAEIAVRLCEEFDVDAQTVTDDLVDVARSLLDEGILQPAG